MRVLIVSNKDIADIIAMYAENRDKADLVKSIAKIQGESLSSYIYNVMTTYMVNYLPIGEVMSQSDIHNLVYDKFEGVAKTLDMVNPDILNIDRLDTILGNTMSGHTSDPTASICGSIYEDCQRELEDYYAELYGTKFMDEQREAILDDLEEVVTTISHTVKELESRYLKYNEQEGMTSNVLFGYKNERIVIVVD